MEMKILRMEQLFLRYCNFERRQKGVFISVSQQSWRIAWRGRRDLNPRLTSNISDLTAKPLRTIINQNILRLNFEFKKIFINLLIK